MSLDDGNNSLVASAIAGKSSSVINAVKACLKHDVSPQEVCRRLTERAKEVLNNPVEACLFTPFELVTPTPGGIFRSFPAYFRRLPAIIPIYALDKETLIKKKNSVPISLDKNLKS